VTASSNAWNAVRAREHRSTLRGLPFFRGSIAFAQNAILRIELRSVFLHSVLDLIGKSAGNISGENGSLASARVLFCNRSLVSPFRET
jgi:hypothetical protein